MVRSGGPPVKHGPAARLQRLQHVLSPLYLLQIFTCGQTDQCWRVAMVGLALPFLYMACYVWLTPLQQARECLILEPRLLPVWWDSRQCSPYRTIALARASESSPIPSPSSNACPKTPHARQSLRFVPSGLPCQILAHRIKLTSSGYQHTWAWKEMQQPTKKPSEGACFHSHPLPWTSLQTIEALKRHQRSIAEGRYHMPGSIEHSQTVNTAISVGNGIGPETSASQWHKYALAILRWQQLTCTVSDAGIRPSARTVKAPKKQLNIWYSNVRPTIRPGEMHGLETLLQQTRDTSGTTCPPDRE